MRLADRQGKATATQGLERILQSVPLLHPSKHAFDYWLGINKALVASLNTDINLWTEEKTASLTALRIAKDEALTYLRAERNRLLGLSHAQAIEELVRASGLEARIAQVERVEHGSLLGD